MLILISGLPGSGKTTLARAFAAQTNTLHLNSDLVRRAMGLTGHYRPEDKAAVYDALQARARASLLQGKDVVVDSTFYRESVRAPFRQLAADCGVPLCWVEVRAQETVIRERLKTPRPDSEADVAVYEKIRDEAEPLTEPHLILWSDAEPLENMVASTVKYVENQRFITSEQLRNMVAQRRFPGDASGAELLETHISLVILTPEFVFKIKKPVQFSFLDFSTLEKRAFYCREELRLNRRLAPDMYLDVLPIALAADGVPEIGLQTGPPIDFAVRMKRMDDRRQMDKLLLQNAVSSRDMQALAALLAPFHQSVVLPAKDAPYKPGDNRNDFDDLFQLEDACVQLFGKEAITTFETWRNTVDRFLDAHEPRLHARAESGFWVDGHGDLHGRNIFLLSHGPVVFDCIEFNPHFRQLDVLNDLAFLCMDLDAGGHHELEKAFMDAYLRHWACIETPEDRRLFQYFKAYRANVRLKVTLIAWQQHGTEALEKTAALYWRLLGRYLG